MRPNSNSSTQYTPDMTKKRNFSLLFFAGLMLLAQIGYAQRVIEKDENPEKRVPMPLKSKLWYGGGLQLGFSSYNGGNVFSFGLSPMVGYKIIEAISVGPRVEMLYSSIKVPGYKAISLFDVDAGVFVRAKVFRGLFFQGELSNGWIQQPTGNGTEKITTTRFNQRLGAGWNFGSGQGGGSEIGIFYNFAVANDLYSYENPLSYRFGFTWNF